MTQPERRRFDEAQDATRRTRLANERTYLAWFRTGLTALAVALAVGKVVPDLAQTESRWPYEILGAGFALFGVLCIAYGLVRDRQVERALMHGEFTPSDRRATLGLTCFGVVLGVFTMILMATGK
jgi:putative membrane protein